MCRTVYLKGSCTDVDGTSQEVCGLQDDLYFINTITKVWLRNSKNVPKVTPVVTKSWAFCTDHTAFKLKPSHPIPCKRYRFANIYFYNGTSKFQFFVRKPNHYEYRIKIILATSLSFQTLRSPTQLENWRPC